MPATVYALLVGIDAYHSPVPALHGCKNDIQVIHAYLQEREKNTAAFNLKALLLEDANATREAVIAGFQTHLTQAQKDDVVLFYYSGHGSQELAPKEFWALEPDHLDETLVLVDSRDPGKYDLRTRNWQR